MLKVISLGAGVQSTVMALMAAYGELGELPDYAVFADTQSEPEDVYTHLDWLEGEIKRLTNDRMRCVRVTAGNLEADVLEILQLEEIKGRHPTPPFFTPGRDGLAAPIRRQCTESYKIDPIRQWMRGQIDHPKGKVWKGPPEIECWIGISTDEIQRMRDARDRFVKNRWPLIEARMTRGDCLEWFGRKYPGRSLAKSACWFCPYKKNEEWRRTRDEQPEAWAKALEFDKAIRAGSASSRGEWFLHRKLKPLGEVDLSSAADRGQVEFGFLEECEGMCGI
jgi:hypothetical protein